MKKVNCSICKKIIYRWNYQVKSQKDFYCSEHKKHINKGKHNSFKTEFKKGIRYSIKTEFKKGQPKTEVWHESMKTRKHWCTGLTKDDSRIAEMAQRSAQILKGKRNSPKTEFKKGLIPWNKGKSHMVGKKHPNWKGGITPINHKIRTSRKFIAWSKLVREIWDYTCQICGIKGNSNIHANHIKKFEDYPGLRFEITNGIALCNKCHSKVTGKEKEWESYFNFCWENKILNQNQKTILDFVYRPRYL